MSHGDAHDDDSSALPAPMDTRLIWAALFVSVALFAKVPNIDLWFSQKFYVAGQGFVRSGEPMVQALYTFTPIVGHSLLGICLAVLLLGPVLARLARRQGHEAMAQRLTGLWRRTALSALLVAVLSSGFVVELGLKNVMGRPRPVQTVEFGGTEPFHPAFHLGGHPDKHRSFVSGHAAAGFALISLGLAAGPTWRRRWFLIGLVAGATVGMGRIMQGGHYLSDVIFSFFVVWLSCELVSWGLRRHDLKQLPPGHPARRTPRRALR